MSFSFSQVHLCQNSCGVAVQSDLIGGGRLWAPRGGLSKGDGGNSEDRLMHERMPRGRHLC